jgi:hypothetical protein
MHMSSLTPRGYRSLFFLAALASLALAASCDSDPIDDGGAAASGAAGAPQSAGVPGSNAGAPDSNAGAPDSNAGAPDSNLGSGGVGGSGMVIGSAGSTGDGEAGASQCDDGDSATRDFFKPLYGCGHLRDSDPSDGMSWIVFDSGFSVDPKTGYGWIDLSTHVGASTLDDAQSECAGFSLGGLGNWQIPTIDQARTLAAGCPATVSDGTCPIKDPSCLTQQCGYGTDAECESCKAGGGPGMGSAYCNPDSTLCVFFHTSSLCSDCPSANIEEQDWEYGPSNGNFTPGNAGDAIAAVCVTLSVPGALP